MNFILDNYEKLKDTEGGKQQFSEFICQITPYFSTIKPIVVELRAGYGKWAMNKSKEVENHIGTIHAIAMCNLCEITAGLTTEVSIPENKRWIPIGMNVQYLKKATTKLTAECRIEGVDWNEIDVLDTWIDVKDADDNIVVSANIKMKIGDKKA